MGIKKTKPLLTSREEFASFIKYVSTTGCFYKSNDETSRPREISPIYLTLQMFIHTIKT